VDRAGKGRQGKERNVLAVVKHSTAQQRKEAFNNKPGQPETNMAVKLDRLSDDHDYDHAYQYSHPQPHQPSKVLRVFVLGRFEVEQGGRLLESSQWRTGKARSLFKILLSRRGYQLSRQEAAELLWPEVDQERAANNLYQALYNLRRTLEPELERANASLYLKTEGSKIQLDPALVGWVDLEEFKRLCHQTQLSGIGGSRSRSREDELELYEEAVRLYRGDYLPEDLYEDWTVYRREALREEWIDLLLRLSGLYQERGQEDKSQQCLHRVLETNFSHEGAVQKLLVSLTQSGKREEALAFYHHFAAKLKSRLNLEPLPETWQLYRDIANHRIAARNTSVTNVVVPPTPTPAASVITQAGLVASPAVVSASGSGHPSAHPLLSRTSERVITLLSDTPTSPRLEPASAAATPSSTSPVSYSTPDRGGSTTPQLEKRLVGREALQRQWQEALAGGWRGLSLLSGEAGIGKTSLARALAQQSSAAGYTVFSITCYPQPADLPFSAICELLEQAFSHLEKPELEECLKYCSPSLGRLLPAIAHLLPAIEGGGVSPDFNSQSLFASVAQVMGWVSRQRPVVLVLDDLHNLPGPSVGLLRYLLTHPALRELAVLGTLRPVAKELVSLEMSYLLDWAAETSQMSHYLKRLSLEQLSQLLTERLGQPPAASLLQSVNQSSRGNPRLALDLVAAWRNEGRLELIDGLWEIGEEAETEAEGEKVSQIFPGALEAYLKRLVGNLSGEAQTLLSLAALIGPVFSFDILRQIILHRSDGAGWWIRLDKTRLGQTLTEVTGCGLIADRGVQYYFAYPLLAEFLASHLSQTQRQCWREVIRWAQQSLAAEAESGVSN
jgi:DNA-binding SARP family transcriptional activator/type II secretory pathway predicted ATPase ExeA